MSAKDCINIKVLRNIVRILVGLLLIIYLGLLLFTASPLTQQWLTGRVERIISRELQTRVQVGNVRLGLFNRVVIDDLLLFDQQGDTLFSATRLSSKVQVPSLLKGHYHIVNAQLFGYDLRLRRQSPSAPYNFQFILVIS